MTTKPFRIGRSRTGLGLFATVPIKTHTPIVEYSGKRIPTRTAQELEWLRANKYLFEINSRWTIDGKSRRNMARYVNHACKPNAEAVLSKGRMMYRARKPIRDGEEITVDYGKEYMELYFKPRGCQCIWCREKRGKQRRTARLKRVRRLKRLKLKARSPKLHRQKNRRNP